MIVFANYANNILAGNGDKAWISERFALQIINKKNLQSKYIFPIVGFETHNGCLYILTYGGEIQPVATKTTKEGMLLSNFQYTINLSSWPKWQIEKYSKSKVYYQYVGDKIEVEIKTGKYTEHIYLLQVMCMEADFGICLNLKDGYWIFYCQQLKDSRITVDYGIGSPFT